LNKSVPKFIGSRKTPVVGRGTASARLDTTAFETPVLVYVCEFKEFRCPGRVPGTVNLVFIMWFTGKSHFW